jgi:Domain of unknown function (DUF4261)
LALRCVDAEELKVATMTMPQSAEVRKPQFSAIISCPRHVDFKLNQLIAAVKAIAPTAIFGDWRGPFGTAPSDELGVSMISLDGFRMAILNIDAPLPAGVANPGPHPYWMMPDAPERLAKSQAHVVITKLSDPQSRQQALAQARATTLLACAVAGLTKADGIKWEDANNVMPPAALTMFSERLAQPNSVAVPIWIRSVFARGPDNSDGQATRIAGTIGLWAFGLPEIEFAGTPLPMNYLSAQIYAAAEYCLTSDATLKHGDTIGLDGQNTFSIQAAEPGLFEAKPVLRLAQV